MTTPAVSDDDSPSGDSDSSLSSDGEDIFDEGVEGWSVRVCVVSAVDFPINVVPNIPLSPIIRVALVPLPESAGAESTKAVSDKDNMKRTLDSNGIASIRKSRMRCTASKITSKRDNGSVEFHEEMRWDHVQNPRRTALAVELSARAVMTPANIRESPYAQTVQPIQFPSTGSIGRGSSHDKAGLGSLFRRNRKQAGTSEMETAKAAAAKHLVEEGRKSFDDNDGEEATNSADMFPPSSPISKVTSGSNQSEMDVKLRHGKRRKKPKATEDIRLGSQIVPLTDLPLKKSLEGNETVRIEQWFQLETSHSLSTFSHDVASKSPKKRNPSILLEISLSSREALDESEDDMDEITEMEPGLELKASFSRRASMKIRSQLKKETKPVEAIPKEEEPVLQPGIVDYICVVGARDIGNQKSDDGSSGWVNTTPECGLLEQFPPSDEYLSRSGRNVSLPDKVEWFCFPEGCKLWRGTTPPNAEEMNLNRFSASSPVNIATTIASFDACLGCTTSFSWFVLASNSDEYGSESMKTYGACIRFFVPAPLGIDQTQDDFGQVIAPSDTGPIQSREVKKRLWAPVGICVTSSMPIIGALEVILLRMCEALSSPGRLLGSVEQPSLDKIYEDILNLVMNFHRPIPGVVQCSVPFLSGDPLKITLCPPTGLPSLPHGSAITSVCRLLGADGLVFLLTAMLTECKILLHSDDTSNISLVAEVATALLYPFSWSLPYIPVLPSAMTEVIEAPMPYIVGIPSCNFKSVDPLVLEDVVVVDLDKDLTGVDYFDDTHGGFKSKIPTPLPTSIASNVSKAVYRLLQADVNQSEPSIEASQLNGRTFPRMQGETNVEREFRIAVAMEVCGLVRGYQDCLVYASTTQPVFNVDKFLQNAPILYEEQRGATANASSRQILSPRSRRFVSILVNCQHFHQFLESEQHAEKRFFHHVMSELNAFGAKKDFLAVKRVLSLDAQKTIDLLRNTLQRLEDRTATYSVRRVEGVSLPISSSAESLFLQRFPIDILSPIQTASEANSSGTSDVDGVNHISLEYLVELEKNPWRHQQLFAVESATVEAFSSVALKVKIRDAIGERRYHNWKNAMERTDVDDASLFPDDGSASSAAVDLGSLLAYNSDETSVTTDTSVSEEPASNDSKRRIADAKDRDIIRRCLERANVSGPSGVQSKSDSLLDLTTGAESALRNPSARRFLLSVLTKLSDAQKDASQESARQKKRSSATGPSKLEEGSFETLVRLGCAMLDACMEDWDYNSAYSLLKLTAGLYCTVGDGESASIAYMTQKMGNHPIYADLGVWEKAKEVHLAASRKDTSKQSSDDENEGDDDNDEYEAAVATLYEMLGYGIPAEELARFASRVSENSGWFRSERGQSLLLLARRICMRRDQGEASSASQTSDLEMMSPTASRSARASVDTTDQHETDSANDWLEIGWVHPAAQSSRRMMADKTKRMGAPVQQVQVDDRLQKSGSDSYMKRSAITTMAYLGSSVIVTGGLDGGVFLARRVKRGPGERDEDGADPSEVRGVHLDWGSSGSRYAVGSSAASLDGEYGVGAVSCLAATKATNQSYQSLMFSRQSSRKDTVDDLDDEEVLQAMEGARVVAGTTCGDLRVWSVKDVLSAVFYANHGGDFGSAADSRTSRPDGSSSSFLSKRKSGTDYAAGSSLTRLKFSLRGRALSGHRGGVSCIDVPSHVYRPDSIISGGADGLIKLWSLRTSAAGRRNELDQGSMLAAASKGSTESMTSRAKSSRSGDALSILSGHGGRILCIKTAWHGDRLLSGGADRTVRVWDLAGSGGKCLHSLSGHLGWVTSVQYWGPNTIISASTDRSIALWDARVRNSPLFALRHHNAPISSVLVGTRTDPIMASAASDGTIAAWDFRRLSDAESGSPKLCKVVRSPAAKLYLHDFASRRKVCGPVVLSRGPNAEKRTILCAGRDAVVREWDVRSGDVVAEHATGHCDTISTFSTFQGESLTDTQLETTGSEGIGGTITTSWDGTVRVRRQVRK
jgi:WD40 repeat protein